jgi:methylmalonyl-CoA/ethylmalonyl-CoA epimerase
MKVDHIGIAVSDLENSIKSYSKLGFEAVGPIYKDLDRNVCIQFMTNNSYRIELISTDNQSTPSPIENIIKKSRNVMYHFCYIVDDLEFEVARLRNDGFALIQSAKPAIALDQKLVAFLFNNETGIIELLEE